MDDCCGAGAGSAAPPCPGCGHRGRQVGGITLKALLRPEALARLTAGEYRFCPAPDCSTVYFREGAAFTRDDVLVPVFQKEPDADRTVCYCFAVTEDQIRRDTEAPGVSAWAERIRALVHAGRCACAVRNPQGTCCLGNVMAVAKATRPAVLETA